MNTGRGQETLKINYGKILEKQLKMKVKVLFVIFIIFGSSIYYLGQKGANSSFEGADRITYNLEFLRTTFRGNRSYYFKVEENY